MASTLNWVTGAATVLVLSLGVPAGAQDWGGSRDRDREYGRRHGDVARPAYDNGYQRGVERGEADARSRRPQNFRDEHEYRDADRGYHRRYGSRDDYRFSFRVGFEAGYYAGYGRYGRVYGEGRAVPRHGAPGYGRYPNGRYGGYGYADDIAFQNGYRDGLEKGEKDWRRHRAFNMLRHDWYRDADHHYRHEYGPRDHYRRAYREGFGQGYEQGFHGGRY